VIDLHTHLLPGIDDGPRAIDGSVDLARWMVSQGVSIAACTPHVRDDHATTPDSMNAALATVRDAVAAQGIRLDIRPGGEIALERLSVLDSDARRSYGLGGNPDLLLIEFPYFGWPLALQSTVVELRSIGTVALIAHPERSSEVQQDPDRLRPLVEAGAYVQITASSLIGEAGKAAERCARKLLDAGLAQVVASDAHGPLIHRAGLGSVRRSVGDEALAEWLTTSVPAALLEGAVPPTRPRPARRRRSWPFG
jgi:protein-tyrosine phosphatase